MPNAPATLDPDASMEEDLDRFMEGLVRRNPHQPEFHQAVEEFVETVLPFVLERPEYRRWQVLERMTEPDRAIIFRVCWQDDEGHVRTNRAYRVQFNNAIGPYKGGLRFHPSVNLSVLKLSASTSASTTASPAPSPRRT